MREGARTLKRWFKLTWELLYSACIFTSDHFVFFTLLLCGFSSELNQFPSLIGIAWVSSWLEMLLLSHSALLKLPNAGQGEDLGEYLDSPSSEWLFQANHKLEVNCSSLNKTG